MRTALALLVLALPAAAQGSHYNYCQAGPNSFGATAQIGCTGSLNLLDSSFTLTVAGCPPAATSFGMFVAGRQQYNAPFGNGTLCVSPFYPNGLYRMAPQALLPGTITCSMSDRSAEFSMIQPGTSWNFQFLYRDPAAGGARFNLSDALHVDFALPPS